MSEKINILKNAESLEIAPEFDGYSKVEVTISTDTNEKQVVTVGTDVGRTLEIEMLQCTDTEQARTAAERILNSLRGFQYQPITATGCILNPAYELGDGITINGVYSGIYNCNIDLAPLITANITAPQDEAIEHEYSTKTSTNKVLTREMDKAYSKLSVTSQSILAEVSRATEAEGNLLSAIELNAEAITAKVSKTGGSGGFSWTLDDSSWSVSNGSTEVFRVDENGASVKGVITATSGKIGGFSIGDRGLYNNLSSFGGSASSGVYIGTDGIQLGQDFKVSTSGRIEANSATLSGTLTVGGKSISAANMRSGAEHGNRIGSGMSGKGTQSDKFTCTGFQADYLAVEDTLSCSTLVATSGITSSGHVTTSRLYVGSTQITGHATVTIDGKDYTFATARSTH